jgi:Flp pilus assembly protein TadG
MIITTRQHAHRPGRRPGTILALMAVTIVALIAFLGLAIDLGMLAIAKTQAQNAADLAALTAARTLNGDPTTTYNNAKATTNAQNILTYNVLLGQKITSSQLTLAFGSYDYNQTTQSFNANFPPTPNVPYTAVNATVTSNNLPGAFSKIFGSSFLPNVTATAQAVHRPRDIGLVMDLSGSMRFGTCLGFDFYTNSRTTNNPDPVYPKFGHYSSPSAVMQGPSSNSTSGVDNYTISPSNTTAPNTSYTRTYINNFYSNAAYATTLTRAFDSYTSTDGGNTWTAPTSGGPVLPPSTYTTTPGGDVPAYTKGTTNYAIEVEDVVSGLGVATRNNVWELDGYSACTNGAFSNTYLTSANYPGNSSGTAALNATGQSVAGAFSGYTKGPGYYGKTFFIWPPDPRRPLNTGTATAWSSIANDQTAIQQFLYDFGYTALDFNNTAVFTKLTANIDNKVTTINVIGTGTFPATVPYKIVVGSETMNVKGASGTTFTVDRAVDGTTAAAASTGVTVGLATKAPLLGIFSVPSNPTQTGSHTWPWPSGDDGTGTIAGSLSSYLVNNVYKPGPSNAKLTTSDAAFKQIMRLYNWNYVIDNVGTPCDWRIRFFGTNDNTKIFNASGSLNPPGSTGMWPGLTSSQAVVATYNEILRWLASSTDPFPTQLRAGRVKYYTSIPAPTATSTGTWPPTYTGGITGSYPSWGGTDQRFWVESINYMLGYFQTGTTSYQDVSAMAGYGSDFTWGTQLTSAPPAVLAAGAGVNNRYMNYTDNPARGLLRLWMGPLNMVDYLQSYNMAANVNNYFFMQPGDSYEAPLYTGKEGFAAAIQTMKANHPNDWFSLAPYSWPRSGANTGSGRFNCVSCPMGTNYAYATSALFFPYSTINADGSPNKTEITPYDVDPATSAVPSANFVDTPRADGDTCFAMALMLCYNQFAVTQTSDNTLRGFVSSTPITFPPGMAGGQGRKGAQKVIIFETDGLANCDATATLVSAGTYKYYQIRYDMNNPNSSEYPTVNPSYINDPAVLSHVYSLVDQLKADYGTTRNPFRLYTLGFGPVFAGPDAPSALSTLQTMQFHAGTQSSAATPLPSNQIITGTDSVMSANMVAAFTSILQNGVQIALTK